MSIPSRASFSNNSKTITKTMPKSILLRDYLLDDMSSCSSNGFRSYPRRPCCTTVRFLMEMDLNLNPKLPPKQIKTTWKSKPKRKQYSMLQRASNVMFNAFKHFSIKSTNIMSRNLSKHGLWKKTDHNRNEIKRLISFGDLLKETEFTTEPTITTKVITSSNSNVSSISYGNGNGNSNSWSESGLTATTSSLTASKSFEVSLTQNDDFPERNEKTTNVKRVGVITTTATGTNSCDTTEDTKEWQKDQDEQFSPVSVMDFPSDNDDEDEVSSRFQNRDPNVEGTKKLIYKTRRFESVRQLEPVRLEDRIAESDLVSSTETRLKFSHEENQAKKKAKTLLQLMKSTILSDYFMKHEALESLLLGFFEERMTEENASHYEMLRVAKDWMDGQMQEMFLDWESQDDKQTYIKEMEKGFRWSKYDDKSEKEHIVMELEHEICNSLVDNILLDFQM